MATLPAATCSSVAVSVTWKPQLLYLYEIHPRLLDSRDEISSSVYPPLHFVLRFEWHQQMHVDDVR